MVSLISNEQIRNTYNFVSSSCMITSESWNCSAPRDDSVRRGSGGIPGNMRVENTEKEGIVGPRVPTAVRICGRGSDGLGDGQLRPNDEWISACSGGTGIGSNGLLVTPGVRIVTSCATSPTARRSCAVASIGFEGLGPFQCKKRGLEGGLWDPVTS